MRPMQKLNRRMFTVALAGAALAPVLARAEPDFEAQPDFSKRFAEVGTQGVFVVLRLRDNRLIVSDEGRARLGYVPASTYKVPHALIALETGVVADADKELIRWDGQVRSIEAWNKDHTLRSAMAVSAVPVFQQIARRIGTERMKKYLDAFQYGNREVGPEIDRFWLDGPLKTSALDQIEFFDRLRRGDLPLTDARSNSGVTSFLRRRCRAVRSATRPALSGSTVRLAKRLRSAGLRAMWTGRGFIDLCVESRRTWPARPRAQIADREVDFG